MWFWTFKINKMRRRLKDLEERVFRLEHPPRFSVGEGVYYLSGREFIPISIVALESRGGVWFYHASTRAYCDLPEDLLWSEGDKIKNKV